MLLEKIFRSIYLVIIFTPHPVSRQIVHRTQSNCATHNVVLECFNRKNHNRKLAKCHVNLNVFVYSTSTFSFHLDFEWH